LRWLQRLAGALTGQVTGLDHVHDLAPDSAENTAMSDLACFLGFERHQDRDGGPEVIHSLWL
jgi:hypothetical protein